MRRAALVLAAAAALAACGGSAGDVLAITVAGGPSGGARTIVVSGDGRASCNRGPLHPIASADQLTALGIARDAKPETSSAASYPPGPAGGRSFTLRDVDGNARWYESNAGVPPALVRAELLTLRLERMLCP